MKKSKRQFFWHTRLPRSLIVAVERLRKRRGQSKEEALVMMLTLYLSLGKNEK